ncbi:MAG: histidine phosphatase family protein [Pseudomonadota bacterium]
MSDPTRWWWVRHAPTHSKGFVGWTDVEADLSDTDRIHALSGRLPERAKVLTSDLRRTVATEAALRRTGWDAPDQLPGLREQHFGAWDGRTAAAVEADDGERLARFWQDMAHASPPDGESFAELANRVRREIEAQNETGSGDIVAVVHAGVIRAALAVALDLSPVRALAFDIAPLSLTRLTWYGTENGWGVDGVNAPA